MPSKDTFTIKPIKEILKMYVPEDGRGWADPFAGWNSPAQITNDLNPEAPTIYHVDALVFIEKYCPHEILDGVLFDPPYSPRQVSECYKGIGMDVGMKTTQSSFWSKVKDAAARKLKLGGVAISCCWNTTGFGECRGFVKEELLVVCHGGWHNDTLVVVEKKISDEPLRLRTLSLMKEDDDVEYTSVMEF